MYSLYYNFPLFSYQMFVLYQAKVIGIISGLCFSSFCERWEESAFNPWRIVWQCKQASCFIPLKCIVSHLSDELSNYFQLLLKTTAWGWLIVRSTRCTSFMDRVSDYLSSFSRSYLRQNFAVLFGIKLYYSTWWRKVSRTSLWTLFIVYFEGRGSKSDFYLF